MVTISHRVTGYGEVEEGPAVVISVKDAQAGSTEVITLGPEADPVLGTTADDPIEVDEGDAAGATYTLVLDTKPTNTTVVIPSLMKQ